jgi:elongation factor Tu
MHARLQLWSKEQGGRHTPIFDGYRPAFRAATDGHGDVDLACATVTLPADQPMMLPGSEADVDLSPGDAALWESVTPGLALGVFEGDSQIGTATVLAT